MQTSVAYLHVNVPETVILPDYHHQHFFSVFPFLSFFWGEEVSSFGTLGYARVCD